MPNINELIAFETTCYSFTGATLYSDTFIQVRSSEKIHALHPLLNRLELIPLIGNIAGFFRIALALIHMVGHTIAGMVTQDVGHFYHVLKGAAELLRGVIVILPIIGTLFVWHFDSRIPLCCDEKRSNFTQHSIFLVKIVNPESSDFIDLYGTGRRGSRRLTEPS